MDFLGGLLGAGISAITKIFGGNADRKAAEQQAAANRQAQLDFAQHGVTWKAQDATQAQDATGINRLALLGVPTNSFSNVVGGDGGGAGISGAGQDIGRAIAAATSQQSRADQLNEKLLEAKIANVNADTVRMQAAASAIATKLGQPGTANVPFPTPDPRGPVIPLMQRARDPRTGEIVWIPSEKAASPLQTLAATPLNAALGGKSFGDIVFGGPPDWHTGGFLSGAAKRATDSSAWSIYTNSP